MMHNILEKYVLDTEYVFDDEFENDKIKKTLSDLIEKLPTLKYYHWNRLAYSKEELYVNATITKNEVNAFVISRIIHGCSRENNYLFFLDKKIVNFYNNEYFVDLDMKFLREFFKRAAIKIGLPKCVACSSSFINKLEKQFREDSYFEKIINKDTSFINLKNATLSINRDGIKLEKHHPKYFLDYILDFDYLENEKHDTFLDFFKSAISSIDMQKTLQQAISQVLVKNFYDGRKICLYKLKENTANDFISTLKEVIPHDLVVTFFGNNNVQLDDLFINFEDVRKDKKSLEKVIFISFDNLSERNLPKNLNSNKSAVLNWLIDGAKEIMKNRQLYIAKESEEFKDRFNIVKLFVEESNFTKTPKSSKSIVTTYENVLKQYESFCELHDEEPLGRGTFNKELKALGFESTRRESGNVWFAKFA